MIKPIIVVCGHSLLSYRDKPEYQHFTCTVKPVLSGHSKNRPKNGFQDRISLNAGQKYCRMLQREDSELLLAFIRLPFVIKVFVLSIFEWLLKTGFTVASY